jgi:hypothetical protein
MVSKKENALDETVTVKVTVSHLASDVFGDEIVLNRNDIIDEVPIKQALKWGSSVKIIVTTPTPEQTKQMVESVKEQESTTLKSDMVALTSEAPKKTKR